ncbi:MAG: homoserine kinase [Blastocatellia bacterium]|nr:homoserine kinase [Blastocatellia bacterium]
MDSFSLRIPGSTSNLGAGFDTLGLALAIYLNLTVDPASGDDVGTLDLTGEGESSSPFGADNLIHTAFRFAASGEGVDAPAVRFTAHNDIPFERGLGSSAAAIVAGIVAFSIASGRGLSNDRIIELGTAMEGHGDNAGPSTVGGLITCCQREGAPPLVVRTDWPRNIRAVVAIPTLPIPTAEARAILPARITRADAIFNIQRAALFHAALAAGEWEKLGEAMRDRLHQPYRAGLLPGLAEALELETGGSLIGVALSGAGSAVLALATGDFERIGERLAECFRRHGIATAVRVLEVEARGWRRLD